MNKLALVFCVGGQLVMLNKLQVPAASKKFSVRNMSKSRAVAAGNFHKQRILNNFSSVQLL
jgi:hypothetical protein